MKTYRLMILLLDVIDTNIDEVLNLTDLSLIPKSFLTEIQHDQVYETILEVLQKKIPYLIPLKHDPIQEEDEHPLFSPHLLAIDDDDDDDDLSIPDESSSATSTERTNTPNHDDYDTDIEPGKNLSISIHSLKN